MMVLDLTREVFATYHIVSFKAVQVWYAGWAEDLNFEILRIVANACEMLPCRKHVNFLIDRVDYIAVSVRDQATICVMMN